MDLLNSALQFLSGMPSVGPILVKVLGFVLGASVIVTALFAVWKAVVAVMLAVANIGGMSGLKDLANKLSMEEDSAEGFFKGKVMPILDRLSLLAPPQQK